MIFQYSLKLKYYNKEGRITASQELSEIQNIKAYHTLLRALSNEYDKNVRYEILKSLCRFIRINKKVFMKYL